jgi:hypothetical protein
VIAEQLIYTEDQRLSDRDAALRDVLTCTAGLVGLSHRGEADIRVAVMRHVDVLLDLADHATVARLELEAIESRMDVHVRQAHVGCSADSECRRWRVLQRRRNTLWNAWAAAYRALVGGRR